MKSRCSLKNKSRFPGSGKWKPFFPCWKVLIFHRYVFTSPSLPLPLPLSRPLSLPPSLPLLLSCPLSLPLSLSLSLSPSPSRSSQTSISLWRTSTWRWASWRDSWTSWSTEGWSWRASSENARTVRGRGCTLRPVLVRRCGLYHLWGQCLGRGWRVTH